MDQKQIEEIVRSVMASMGQDVPQPAAPDAPRDKCAPFREINGIAAAFQYSQKNYNPTASSFL